MRTLGKVLVGAHQYRLKLVPPGHKALEGARGITDVEKHVIHVADDGPETLNTLVHEVVHAVMYESGASSMLFGAIEDDDAREKAEEHLVLLVTPHIVHVLAQMRGVAWSRKLKNVWPKKGKKS